MAIPCEDISIVRILASTIVVCILASTSLVLSFISFTSCIRYGFTSTHGVRSNSADAGPVRCLSPHGASNVRYRETEERYRCIGGAIGDVVAEWRFSAFVRRSVFESTDTTNVLKEGRMGQISTNHGGLPSIPVPLLQRRTRVGVEHRATRTIRRVHRRAEAFPPCFSQKYLPHFLLSLCCSLFSSYRSNGGRVSVISRTRARSPAISPRTNSKSLCLGSGPSPSGLMTSSRTASFTGVVPSALPSELAFCRITSTPPRTGSTASKAPVGIYRRNG